MVDNPRPVKKRTETAAAGRRFEGQAARPAQRTLGATIREMADELVFMFVLVMFIKTFLVEHYKIPTGSMTPTLIGGVVAQVDVNGDGVKDLVYAGDSERLSPSHMLVFSKKKDGGYEPDRDIRLSYEQVQEWASAGLFHKQYDHILVDRFSYWLRPPRRGEIVVFKVPPSIFTLEAPIYIKRCVGEPGDTLTFTNDGRLVANGHLVKRPPFFHTWHYRDVVDSTVPGFSRQSEIDYEPVNPVALKLDAIHVPAHEAYVFGDNTWGSLDSRYWGGVPLDNFKGRAFLRVWPLMQFKFLR